MSEPPEFPQYRAAPVATCPECDGDLEHAGAFIYWCSACQKDFHFTAVVLMEGDDDD